MSIGLGIFLLVIGAIIKWAVPALWEIHGFDWSLIGVILMAAGVLVLIFGIIGLARSGRSSRVSRTSVDPATGERVESTRYDDGV